MREITIGGKQVTIRATAMSLKYYYQEFDTDLVADLFKLQDSDGYVKVNFDRILYLQIVWAMSKANDFDKAYLFPSFEKWLLELGKMNLADTKTISVVMEEAADGFFRTEDGIQGEGQ